MLLRVVLEIGSQLFFFYFMSSIQIWTKGTGTFHWNSINYFPSPIFDEPESLYILWICTNTAMITGLGQQSPTQR